MLDLGEWWLLETGLPLPLGVNTVRRDIGDEAVHKVSDDPRASRSTPGSTNREEALDTRSASGAASTPSAATASSACT